MSTADLKEALNKMEKEWKKSEALLQQYNDSSLKDYAEIMHRFAQKHNWSAMYGLDEDIGVCGNCSDCKYYDPDMPPEICELLLQVCRWQQSSDKRRLLKANKLTIVTEQDDKYKLDGEAYAYPRPFVHPNPRVRKDFETMSNM
jgi:hypothetical protein